VSVQYWLRQELPSTVLVLDPMFAHLVDGRDAVLVPLSSGVHFPRTKPRCMQMREVRGYSRSPESEGIQ